MMNNEESQVNCVVYIYSIYNTTNHMIGQDIESAYPSPSIFAKWGMAKTGKSTLGYNANNLYAGIPPKMDDARSLVAAWQPEAVINHQLVESVGVQSNWQYRKYLTKNADEIMQYNRNEAYNDIGYYKRFTEAPIQESKGPHLYSSLMDATEVRGVDNSDLKQLYLSREQLESRKISPSITQEELLKYKSRGR